MNKLLLNRAGRNHIRFFPMPDTVPDIPDLEADRIRWCESRYKALERDPEAKRLCLYKNRTKGYLVSVWESGGLYYLIQCIRNEWKTFDDTIYVTKDGNDAVAIAKFVHENIETIMADYRQQILDARDQLLRDKAARVRGPADA